MYKSISEIVRSLEESPIENGGNIYHPIPFEEFNNLKTSTDNIEFLKKWAIIKSKIDELFGEKLKEISVLDIGSNGGFFTFSLSKEVANVTAFESHPRYGEIGKSLTKIKKINNVEWHNENFNLEKIKNETYDITLMLSVFQWIARGGENLEESLELLKEISKRSKYLVFELGFNSGKSCLTTQNPDHFDELIKMLKRGTIYNNFELIGKSNFWHDKERFIVLCY
ncbi:methyltransferase family protein [Ureibacillus xyleni]|uniref:Methyltransferase family protein n=1 Tax=Ureibacillus xyleni TaxID=614648 RepID=A0A285RB64_9BACL|nr:class I SAM-dependent methyltransferase [Ureibacillus xyleni]SOB91144.1 methyltransferase family protein [Ureibacillus xyleni]